MQLVTLTCPGCGAPVNIDENTLAVLCTYCGSQVQRLPEKTSGFHANMERGLQALKTAQYEQADLCFSEALKNNPQDQRAWLYRAIVTELKPYGLPADALGYLHASRFSVEEAITHLAPLTSASSLFFDDCLKHCASASGEAASLTIILLEGALQSTNPAHKDTIAQILTNMADRKWQEGQVDQAIAYLKRAWRIDPGKRSQNLWLLELAQKS